MIKFFPALLITLVCITASAQEKIRSIELKGYRIAVTPKLSKWKPDRNNPLLKIKTRDEKGLIFSRNIPSFKMTNYANGSTGPDPLWQQRSGIPENRNSSFIEEKSQPSFYVSSNNSFDGISFTSISPADPTIAVGRDHIIQMVNGSNGSAYFKVFSKSGGQLSFEAFMDQLPGTSYNGAGDCITWYDQLTDRFVMTEFGDSSQTGVAVNSLIMAVSASSDPLGSWYVYEFPDASFFPDYPKYANWHDAWYGMTRDFTGSYIGNSIWAFDKMKMIRGESTVSVQRIRLLNPDNKFNSLCPVSLAGSTPAPPGTPGMFLYFSDDNFSASSTDTDSLGLVGFSVNFSDPSKSSAGILQSLPVAPFRSDVCLTRNCAPSASGQGYDVVSNRIMNRPYYRNLGIRESIVATHTVDATGTGVSGLRWYELRKSGSSWLNYQQGTFAPQDLIQCTDPANKHRFMGAITMNSAGQIALAYNTSSATSFASIGFTGRNTGDPLNSMSYEETIAVAGTGFGSFGNRWGDYSEITPDPLLDSVFWFSGMYGTETGWNTRIFSFKLGTPKQTDAKLVSIDHPNACESSCNTAVEPRITIRNAGLQSLTSLLISYQVDAGLVQTVSWTGNLGSGAEETVKLPQTIFPLGDASFMVRLVQVNGLTTDDDITNNSKLTTTSIGNGITLPLTEGFENILYPPIGWSIQTSLSPAENWQRTTNAARSGTGSAFFDNFDQNQPSRYADLFTPLINLDGSDSLELAFQYAAAYFGDDNVDTLEVLISIDCGKNFQSVWKRNAKELATREGSVNTAFIPARSEWRRITVDLNNYTNAENVIVAFRNINGFGNMIYLDDIEMRSASLPGLDLAIAGISEPAPYICTNTINPIITFSNTGLDTIKTATFKYSIDGGAAKTMNWNGLLGRKEHALITMPGTTVSAGDHRLVVYGVNPNQGVDANHANDSMVLVFQVKQMQGIPLVENFDNGLPPEWMIVNESRGRTWVRSGASAKGNLGSMFVRNYNNNNRGNTSNLISPWMNYSNADSVFLSFSLAAAGFNPAITNATKTDTLEIFVSSDCGKTLTSVYKKWGKQLQTISDNRLPASEDFIPITASEWRTEKIDLTELLGRNNNLIAVFSNTNQGINNVYVDEVNVYTKRIPEKLRTKGLLISPNPFSGRFVIQHYPDARDLKSIEVFNSIGQQVYRKKGSGFDSYIEIDLSAKPAGMYFVKLIYSNKQVTEKILKGH